MLCMGFQIPAHNKLQAAYAKRKDELFRLLKAGKSQAEAARELGISRARVSQLVKAHRVA